MNATQAVLQFFEQLSVFPRGSGHEEQISGWLQQWAASHGFPFNVDDAGNLVIKVPATGGYEHGPVVVLQGHMDMVCEKTPTSAHNFLTDPIEVIVDGDWLHANQTTLGADNGIAIAIAMAIVEDGAVAHPALELLFTVSEEVGMGGANHLQPGFITGKTLINLDSEDEGTFIIGCAGGQSVQIMIPLAFESPENTAANRLHVGGLQGGHSGVDIHKHRGSANKLLARVLNEILKITPLRMANIKGGTAHNAISRGAEASFVLQHPGVDEDVRQTLKRLETIINQEYAHSETGVVLDLTSTLVTSVLSQEDTQLIIRLLSALPHGVAEMSASVPGFVETSNNLARIEIVDQTLRIVSSQRSTVMTRMQDLSDRIAAVGSLAGADVVVSPAYPGWQPDLNSMLLKRSTAIYRDLFGVEPNVRMIHAGLECGTIGSIYGDMDMISIGATIENPHSPTERLYLPSIPRVWDFLVAYLQTCK